jgi:calcium/calmodulin-dependent protein kinase I
MSITDKYIIQDELGRGAFSIVKLAVEKETGNKYAVKIIHKSNVGQDMARLQTEMEILKKVNHPNIISLKEIIDTKNCLFIVTELVTGGELFDKIVELGQYSEKDAATLVSKMVSAIDYLHDINIVHRDLKPENLLLKDAANISEVKLADFGLSKIVGTKVMMQTACGTPGYVAPEVLNATGYDKEVDMWSIGVITYILLCGFPPFYNDSLPELFEQIMKADYDFPEDYWKDVSEEAKDFIRRLLVVDPSKRMTGKDALKHPWLLPSTSASAHKLPRFNQELNRYVAVRKQQSKVIGGELNFG